MMERARQARPPSWAKYTSGERCRGRWGSREKWLHRRRSIARRPGSASFPLRLLKSWSRQGTVRCPWLEDTERSASGFSHPHPPRKGIAAGWWPVVLPPPCRLGNQHLPCLSNPSLLCKTRVAPPSAQLYYSGKPLFPHPSPSFTYVLHKEARNTWDKIQNILIKFVLLPSALLPRLKLNIAKASLPVGTNTNSWNKGMINQGQVALMLPSGWGDCCLSMMALAGCFYVPNCKGFVITEQRHYCKA